MVEHRAAPKSSAHSRALRILLVKPKPRLATVHALHRFQFLEPIELGYLAAAVPPAHEVRVLDLRLARFAALAFRRALRSWKPDLVGITGYSHEASTVKSLAAEVRAILPAARVVVGGHHATVATADYDVPEIDAIVRGEGCLPFRSVVNAVAAGAPLCGIDGVYLPGEIEAAALASWPTFPDPSLMPVPRRDLWDSSRYFSVWPTESGAMTDRLFPRASMVRTSFGCRMHCSFCIVPKLFNGRHYARPVDEVAEEIAAVPSEHVYFCDDENFIDPGFAHELAGALERRGVRKRYFAWTRATTVNRHPDLFRRWRALGLDAAFLGFEFPTDDQLRASHKGTTVADNERAHDCLRAEGVAVHAAFMLDPGFSETEFERLRAYVRDMPPAQFSFTICTPSPGTDDYKAIRESIWAPQPFDVHDCMHPLTATRLPLREFAARYARQVREAAAKNPRRASRRPVHPLEIPRVIAAEHAYTRAFENLYRDYPRELWGD